METLFQKGAGLIASLTARSCGQAVNFRRGDSVATGITAVVGSKLFRYNDSSGFSTVSRTRDFIVDRADLLAAIGEDGEPRDGDVIEQVDENGDSIDYQVAAPNGEPVFRYVDTSETRVRIHTFRNDRTVEV